MAAEGKGLMKTVYVVMSAEFIHPGHINIIRVARDLGEVTVGVATDEFNARYKRLPMLSYEQRKTIVENIKGVKRVIPQDTLNLEPVLRKLKPDYFVHGDDWKAGPNREVRQQVVEVMEEWGGKLVEPPYTEGVSSTILNAALKTTQPTPEFRIQRFRRLLKYQPVVRIFEIRNRLTGLIVEDAQIKSGEKLNEFHVMWYGTSMLPSPDENSVHPNVASLSWLNTVQEILDSTTKPLIVVGGNGGTDEQLVVDIRTLEQMGVAGMVLQDKLDIEGEMILRNGIQRKQEDVEAFAKKIMAGKNAQGTDGFSMIAGINALGLQNGLEDALNRAQTYQEAGADAIMIQPPENDLEEFYEFCRRYKKFETTVPLFAMISMAPPVHESQWVEAGIQGVIYPGHLLNSAYTNLMKTAELLLCDSTSQVDASLEK